MASTAMASSAMASTTMTSADMKADMKSNMKTDMKANVQVREIAVEQTYPLRQAVLKTPHILESDADSIHYGLFENGCDEAVAVCSVERMNDERGWRVRKMAVAESKQRQGYGGRLLSDVFELVKEQGCPKVWLKSRTTAQGFYQKVQMRCEDPTVYLLCGGLPHVTLVRDLSDNSAVETSTSE